MRARSISAALLVSTALIVAPSATAFADGTTDSATGVTKSATGKVKGAAAKARAQARKLEHAINGKRSVVLGGSLVGATLDDPATTEANEGSLTLTVHGGRFKLLRGTDFVVTVDPSAKVTREGLAGLADLVAGDHVVVRLKGVDLSVTKDEAGQWVMGGTASAVRVAASPAETETEPVVTTAPTS